MAGNVNKVWLKHYFCPGDAWNMPSAGPLNSGHCRSIWKQYPCWGHHYCSLGHWPVPWWEPLWWLHLQPGWGGHLQGWEHRDAKCSRDRLAQEQCKVPAGVSWSQMVTLWMGLKCGVSEGGRRVRYELLLFPSSYLCPGTGEVSPEPLPRCNIVQQI